MATSIPVTALLAFCSLAFAVQGVIIGITGETATFPSADFSGGFFSDLGALASWFFDFITWIFRFITFDFLPATPWFIQYPLALICGGSLLVVAVWLTTEAVKAIGGLIPFT